ncbi:Factor arrest protein 11 [Tilletia horrida]|uniref:Factor arrest protein 11 n=1 Tax=Tilletia horrida TaxID=155126 RepID=A0AAN6JW53_9BASI|nr:Factor arrest protein 11 [Tilletia horrida]KAK0569259.1 Factor arrest protein 11 [Tilletia horrida]
MARSAFLGGRREAPSIISPTSGPGSGPGGSMGPGAQGTGGSMGHGANTRFINIDTPNSGDPMRAVMDFPRPRIPQYDFPTQDDTDTTRNEIDEFYSYVEAPQITENRVNWEEWVALAPSQRGGGETGLGAGGVGLDQASHDPSSNKGLEDGGNNSSAPEEGEGEGFGSALGLGLGFEASPLGESKARSGETIGEWIHLPYLVRKKTFLALLATLEVREPVARVRASRALLYLLQGAFADTTSPEHQLHWIQENARMVRAVGGVGEIFHALKVTIWKHEWLGSLPDFIPAPVDADMSTGDAEPQPLMTPQAKAEYMDEINLELALHFAQLYVLMETGRGDEEWGDELMSLDPPMPIYLMNLLASLREKNAKGFPVKKLLLLTWKTILACFGGQSDLARCKQLAREIEGLPPAQDQKAKAVKTKSSPSDIKTFQEEITVKYPSYQPPPKQLGELPLEQIASAITPIPQRRPFGMLDGPGGTSFSGPGGGNNGHQPSINGFQGPNGGHAGNNASPGTPAPTPPPSPKPNKLKFQTDQSRPFVFPYSLSVQGPRTVPYAIEEAGRLYRTHMHVSLEMWQMWRVREQCIFEETGVGAAPDGTRVAGLGGVNGLESSGAGVGSQAYQRRRKLLLRGDGGADLDGFSESGASGLSGSFGALKVGESSSIRSGPRGGLAFGGRQKPSPLSRREPATGRGAIGAAGSSSHGSRSPTYTEAPPHSYLSGSNTIGDDGMLSNMEAGEATVERLQDLETTLTEEIERLENDHELAASDNERWTVTLARLRQQRADARRLQRVDLLFRAILPNLHSAIIVLLKLLLAGVTAQNSTNSPHAQALAEGVPVDEAPPPTVEDIDIIRHREITTKAIGAILLLCLKWFKTSHVMKFHFLSQLLVDSNCLLLILKMFGLQDHTHAVKTRNEVEMYNFFNYCYSNGGREPRMSLPEDAAARQRAAAEAAAAQGRGKGSDEGHHGGPGGRGLAGRDSPTANAQIHLADGEEYEIVSEYSWRTFFSFISFTRIIQKLTKRRVHRILLMTQYKSSAILKRMLRVHHPDLHMYILKVLKSQVPYCGRKWKQTNMKLITAIYLNCRPELRDEWLAGMDIDGGLEDSLPQEQALRALIKFYLNTRYGPLQPPGGPGASSSTANANSSAQGQANAGAEGQAGQGHRRAGSSSHFGSSGGSALANGSGEGGQGEGSGGEGANSGSMENSHGGGSSMGGVSRSPSGPGFFESDIFPPLRRSSESTAGTLRYIPDDVVEGYLDNYEDVLGEVFGHGNMGGATGDDEYGPGWTSGKWGLTQEGSETAWARLGEILGTSEEDAASESAASGAEDGEGELKGDGEGEGNRTWENLSPKEMRYLTAGAADDAGLDGEDGLDRTDGNLLVAPGSPLANRRRRTSSIGGSGALGGRSNSDSSPLRPVLDFDKPDDGSAVDDEAGNRSGDGGEGGVGSDGTTQNGGGVNDQIEPPLPTPIDGGIDEVAHLWGV